MWASATSGFLASVMGASAVFGQTAQNPTVADAFDRLDALEARMDALESDRLEASQSLSSSPFNIRTIDIVAEENCPSSDISLDRVYFRVCFSVEYAVAHWVGYRLNERLLVGSAPRLRSFRADNDLPENLRARDSDYTNSGFDRGHMAPAAAFKRSRDAMAATFLLSNAAPQTPHLNRYYWRNLEAQVRDLARQSEEVWVFTGNIILSEEIVRLPGRASVAVPTSCFKIVLQLDRDGSLNAYAFIMDNVHSGLSRDIHEYARSIDEIERLSGLDFLAVLPDALEREVESSVRRWPYP